MSLVTHVTLENTYHHFQSLSQGIKRLTQWRGNPVESILVNSD